MTLDQVIITVLRNAHKSGLSLDEFQRRMPVQSAVELARMLKLLEKNDVLVSAVVDDNSPPGQERRIYYLRKEKLNTK